ncbi:DUF4861 domain-containing protein [bacterium]|nr:DUF4861 domain-containing protein [bacterium]
MILGLIITALVAPLSQAAGLADVFGSAAVTLDAAKVAQVKAGVPGTRYWYDTNSDGKPEEVWFIDIDPRHTGSYDPILVKCIDMDGDLRVGLEGDHDSDLYIIDWAADGTVNRAVSYSDDDHDGDMDAMGEYSNSSSPGVLWAQDVDDDNLLWWDQNYTYYQTPCQDHCHFAGERTSILTFSNASKKWIPGYESPFFFIDNNKDGVGDEVVRVTVQDSGVTVLTLRWSFNVKGIGSDDDPRNYDCSISAYPVTGTRIEGDIVETMMLNGFPITPMLSYEKGRGWLRGLTWLKGCFTWVENDNNVGWQDTYTSERWEGVINHGSTNFVRIGGPSCGPYNNRNEIDLAPTGPFDYYYNPADHRIHLKSADEAFLAVDWNGDFNGGSFTSYDMRYDWTDVNHDGLLDHVTLDADGNGTTDDQWDIATNAVQALPYEWQAFHDAYAPVLRDYPAQLYDLDRSLAAALEVAHPGSSTDAVWSLIENKFTLSTIPEWKRVKFLNSDVSLIYYLELVRDRQIIKLRSYAGSDTYFWSVFNAFRTSGMIEAMAWQVRQSFGLGNPSWTPFATWIANLRADTTKRVNSSSAWLPGGIAWETEQAAWRVQSGRIDFLGKREKRLVLDGLTPSTDLSTDSGGWGMDALNEGTGPGSGGLTLYVNGTAYPLYGTALTSATYRVVEQTNQRVTVEMMINKAGPANLPRSIQVRATAQVGRADTQFTALVQGGPRDDRIELGVGLTRLAETYFENNTTSGILGVWGFQTPQIDWVGLGIIYPPGIYSRLIQSPGELDVVLKAYPGKLVDWTIKNDWRRGRRFSNHPILVNWMRELTKTASSITFPERTAADGAWILFE